MFPSNSTRTWLLEKYSGLYFLEKTSWGNKPPPRWLSWQNRSHYLVYPHGNLTVYHVTYIFSTDSGLRQASEETDSVGEFSGSQKFAWYDQDKSLMPCSLWIWRRIFIGVTEKVWEWGRHIGAIMWGHHLSPDLLSSEFIKGPALLHHTYWLSDMGGCFLPTCGATMLC